MGIGPTSGAWKALILPLNYICNKDNINYTQKKEHCQHFYDLSFGILRKKGRLVFKITSTIKEKI